RRAASRIDTGPAAHSAFNNSQRLALNTFQSSSGDANAIRAWASPRPVFIARAASAKVSARLRTSRTTVFMVPPRNIRSEVAGELIRIGKDVIRLLVAVMPMIALAAL